MALSKRKAVGAKRIMLRQRCVGLRASQWFQQGVVWSSAQQGLVLKATREAKIGVVKEVRVLGRPGYKTMN